MKIRTGFVSNSSSSSFLIYGAWVDTSDVEKILMPTLSEEDREYLEDDTGLIGEYAEDLPMFVHYDYDYGSRCAFGLSYTNIKDDETGAEFKQRVEKQLEETFGKKIECKKISHSYYC